MLKQIPSYQKKSGYNFATTLEDIITGPWLLRNIQNGNAATYKYKDNSSSWNQHLVRRVEKRDLVTVLKLIRLGEYYGFPIEHSQYKEYLEEIAREMGRNRSISYEGEGRQKT